MIFARRFLAIFAATLWAIGGATGAVRAGQFVQVKSGDAQLVAYLARPPGPGPFPAVVLLHGCAGFHSSMLSWADRLSRWGYAALAVDSFGPREIEHACGNFGDQPGDGYAALHHLAQQSFVRADHVALMGFSLGGSSTLAALESGPLERLFPDKFRAGVAFYPTCRGASGFMTVPTLILIGRLDDWTPAASCDDMVAARSEIGTTRVAGDRSKVTLVVYPDARHAFDVVDLGLLPGGATLLGHKVEYNEAATKDSMMQVRTFLERELKN